jgi:hypothetical protein
VQITIVDLELTRIDRLTKAGLHTGGMTEEPKVDANVDFGAISGYFVRLDIEEERKSHWIALTADEARGLAKRLLTQAEQVDSLRSGKPTASSEQ